MRLARRIKAGLDPAPGYVEVVVVVVVAEAAGAVDPALSEPLDVLLAAAEDAAGAPASLLAPAADFEPLFLKSVTYQPEPLS